ncbi:MAG: tetraacyldisaccharide 4'-kinase [Massilibacteroides sp.]|nr:tetraacyldisaccharide 4'-kinase [Massilibacteroides sp.]MDD3062836.1 tetraacyldisaccharide 4'-kinase [Massilibacteroides sp.]MDD4659416.1 tetraacyldisaccharide 4'-kinase [Massilibacteroides sp.]
MHFGKLNFLLSPLSFFYGIGVGLRNKFFDWGILSSEQFPVPVICVGNLSVGGTGKTPHVELLIRILRKKYRIAVLSRGYKRKTNGFVLATSGITSYDIGDEPYQIYMNFPEIIVAVDADRRDGIRKLLSLPEPPSVILLDDAFQHRYVTPSLSIVLTEYLRPFYQDKLLPFGRLRESKYSIHRSDVVVVTKCPKDIKPIEYRIIEKNMCLTAHQAVFFTEVCYSEIKAVFPEEAEPWSLLDIREKDSVLLISGIAYPGDFIREMKKYSRNVVPLCYPDHHFFCKQDIDQIEKTFDSITSLGKLIVVTEKDAVRFKNIYDEIPAHVRQVMYYLPITIGFCSHSQEEFEEIIKKHIVSFQRENSI